MSAIKGNGVWILGIFITAALLASKALGFVPGPWAVAALPMLFLFVWSLAYIAFAQLNFIAAFATVWMVGNVPLKLLAFTHLSWWWVFGPWFAAIIVSSALLRMKHE